LALARLEASRANVHPPRDAVDENPHPLEVRVEAAPGRNHRVAAAVAERGALPADGADLRHGAVQCSDEVFAYRVVARRRANASAISRPATAASAPLLPSRPPARASAWR